MNATKINALLLRWTEKVKAAFPGHAISLQVEIVINSDGTISAPDIGHFYLKEKESNTYAFADSIQEAIKKMTAALPSKEELETKRQQEILRLTAQLAALQGEAKP